MSTSVCAGNCAVATPASPVHGDNMRLPTLLRPVMLAAGLLVLLFGLTPARAAEPPAGSPEVKARLLVLTDVENEPDDTESLVRLMLYTNVIDVEGLVATTSTHMRNRVAPQSILRVIDAYAQVRDNLLRHEPGFPGAAALRGVVKSGSSAYGMAGVGEGQDTEGSAWIIHCLERPDPRPLWVTAWGGTNTLAQALHTLRRTKSGPELEALLGRLRVYTISDQDDTGAWIRANFPSLFYIVSPGGYGAGAWTGIMHVEPGFDNRTLSNGWLAENIQQGHGPLGAVYPDVAYGMEGDTPSWLGLVPNGLNALEHPNWGGWGGRYELYIPELSALDPTGFTGGVPVPPESRPIWTNAVDEFAPLEAGEFGRATREGEKPVKSFRIPIWRWRDDFQNDFAARMDWTVQPRDKANHPPVAQLGHAAQFTIKSGETFALDAHLSTDPDGDSLSFWWFNYPEAGTWKTPIPLQGAANIWRVHAVAPKVAKPETAHFVVRVTDKGVPSLSRYQRVIVTIVP